MFRLGFLVGNALTLRSIACKNSQETWCQNEAAAKLYLNLGLFFCRKNRSLLLGRTGTFPAMNIQTRATGEAVASHKPSDYAVVYCTVPNQEVARSISSMLVEKSLAACVNTIAGVESTYWWEGKVERDQEQLLIIKTKSSLVPRIAGEIRASHPYDLPEVISLPIQGGLQEYLQWIGSSTKDGSTS